MSDSAKLTSGNGSEIAIIGMSGRFPGARNIEKLWQNLRDGIESISFFSDEELRAVGVEDEELNRENYVKAGGVLEDIEMFDAGFFGFNAREAEILDPQHRVFLEVAWEGLERAGYDPETYSGLIGVYAGKNTSTYILNLYSNPALLESVGGFQTRLANDKDHLPTRVSYKLNLKGPSVAVQTACSTSLVAVHMACQGLLSGECDMAMAGGVSISLPQKGGYVYQEGGVGSPDGHCRAFDAKARGTVTGNGAGVVVLKRLADAVADRDRIFAVIKGSAINNDGSLKVGYTAPSIEGQAEVIMMAQEIAEVEPETISYIEAHGTGTQLGDPIEIAALTKVFRASTQRKGFCAIGSVKSNLGHLDAAAGVTGLIKTVLSLTNKQIPASLHYEEGNPEIDFANSPFYVNSGLREWERGESKRRAGVSSFGIGGTNAHVIVEEWEEQEQDDDDEEKRAEEGKRKWELVVMSARSEEGLEEVTKRIGARIREEGEGGIGDIAYTLQVGRRGFSHRRMLVCSDAADALRVLEAQDTTRIASSVQEGTDHPIAFMFGGLGDHYINMGLGLYQSEPLFREQIDYCAEILKPIIGVDLRDVIYPNKDNASAAIHQSQSPSQGIDLRRMLRPHSETADEATQRLNQTALTQPAMFVIEYALARLWMSWGVRPEAMIGYSLGEYVAACLSGVLSIEDALRLVARRAQLIQELSGGAMLAVPLSEDEARALLGEKLSLSAINGPSLCVVSGAPRDVEALEHLLYEKGLNYRRLQTTHAFHSEMMRPIADSFIELVKTIELNPPRIPYVSNVTGTWISAEEATSPNYWARHLIQPVRFGDGVSKLWEAAGRILLEIGPGQTLGSLAMQHPSANNMQGRVVLASLPYSYDRQPDARFLLTNLGKLWLAGIKVDWAGFYGHERRRRVQLPTYAFERERYWVDPQPAEGAGKTNRPSQGKKSNVADWFYIPSWKRSILPRQNNAASKEHEKSAWLIFEGDHQLGAQVISRLLQDGKNVITVTRGDRFERISDTAFRINAHSSHDYALLIQELRRTQRIPERIVHLWSLGARESTEASKDKNDKFEEAQSVGFYSLLFLAQALGAENVAQQLQIEVVSNGMQTVSGDEAVHPEKATILGPCRVIPQEYANITCRTIDIVITDGRASNYPRLTEQILAELDADSPDLDVAYRGNCRWVQTFEPVRLDEKAERGIRIRQDGVYVITGGLGQIGLVLAKYLAQLKSVKLALIGHSTLPDRSEWQRWLATHGEDDDRQKIKKLLELESLGAEVLVIAANVDNLEQMRNAIAKINQRFGSIQGVIHAAGSTQLRWLGPIKETSQAKVERQFQPKVYGLMVLEKVLQGHEIDFCILLSSLSPILGGIGLVAYSAANLFMDAFAHKHNQTEAALWTSVNWEGWEFQEDDSANSSLPLSELSITPSESERAFERLLSAGVVSSTGATSQIIISVGDLQSRIDRWVKLESLRAAQSSTNAKTFSMHARPNLLNAYVAPRTEIEQALVNLWQELLGTEPIGIHDTFLDLGGHSLLATQFISKVRAQLRVDVSLREFFDGPTIAQLAEHIELAIRMEPGLQAPPILPVPRTADMPPSFAQQRLWFFDQIDPGTSTYNLPSPVRLTGQLNLDALRQSFNEVVRRHEALRTNFTAKNGRPAQIIHATRALHIPLTDLSDLPESELENEVARRIAEEINLPFDLANGSLMRVSLLRLRPDEHLMLLTLHHIIYDAWSAGVLAQEITVLYDAFSNAKPSPLPDLPIQYADFAAWQRQWLQGETLDAQLSYWTNQLAGELPTLDMPVDYPRPAMRSFRGATQSLTFSESHTSALRALGQQEGVTLFMLLLAAFNTLLYRYSGQEDIVVGTPIANRNRTETEGLIGFFVNTLALRTDLSGEPSFKELVGRVREITLGAYAHQDMPFEKLVEEVQPERSLSHNPLFQVMFILQNAPIPDLNLSGIGLNPVTLPGGIAKFDLTLSIEDSGKQLGADLEYNVDLFDAATITRFLDRFQRLLESIVENPQSRICDLPLLSAQELHQIRFSFNDTYKDFPRHLCIHELFEAQAERSPEAVAVVCQSQSLTYRQLNERANRLAHCLKSRGAGPEKIVAICLERGLDLVVAVMAALKSSSAYLPLDPSYPQERLKLMVDDSDALLIVTRSELADRLEGSNAELALIDEQREQISQHSEQNPTAEAKPENLAYLIYTSGSTGKPKAVMVEHRNLVNTISCSAEEFGFREGEQMASLASYSFDIWLFEVMTPLVSGASVRVVRSEELLEEEKLGEELKKVSMIHGVPSLMRQVVRYAKQVEERGGMHEKMYEKVKRVFVGGDKVGRELVEEMKEVFEAAEIVELYGPTEGTIISTSRREARREQEEVSKAEGERGADKKGRIGRALSNVKISIRDKTGAEAGIGMRGEIWIAGEGVSRGYKGAEELTSKKYVTEAGERYYKSGDEGRWTEGGEIEYIGRVDEQVKIRGYRVEIGEVEAAMREVEGVREAVVVVREEQGGEKRLIGYAQMEEGEEEAAKRIRKEMSMRMPEYMVPSVIKRVEEMPMSRNGKIDRGKLRDAEGERPELEAEYVEPQTDAEQAIAAVWQEVLHLDKVGIYDNFFELGGHSLLALEVHNRLSQLFEKEILKIDLFKFPTIKSLAQFITQEEMSQLSTDRGNGRVQARRESLQRRKVPKRATRPKPGGKEKVQGAQYE